MTKHYTINRHSVTLDDDIWSIPSLWDDGGYLTPQVMHVRIVDGVACHPLTVGPAADQQDVNVYEIATYGPLKGWGGHDCDRSYRIDSWIVSADILERIAEWSGLKLPVAA